MSGKRYPEEFKVEAVKQVVDRGHSVSCVATRLGITTHRLYAWLQQPNSQRSQADQMLTGQIKQFWLESGCVYGYSKLHLDLRDTGQQCGVNRVWRLMKRAGIKAQVRYRSPRSRKGEASIVTSNRLQRQFNPDAPDERWVTDITYIRTHGG